MRIKLHQDVEGRKAGETVDVPEKRAKWLLAEGYASTSADSDGVHATSVPADLDPRLAENREKPDDSLRKQLSEGLGTPRPEDADPNEKTPKPFIPDAEGSMVEEVYNVKGDPEKAAKGRETIEKAAARQNEETSDELAFEEDPENAPEPEPDPDKEK